MVNRGRSHPDLFREVPRITADRREMTADDLRGGAWDVVVDMNAYYPAEVEASVAALRGRVRRYVFCSTCSVYAALSPYPVAEEAPRKPCTEEQATDAGQGSYGARKAECERRPGRVLQRGQHRTVHPSGTGAGDRRHHGHPARTVLCAGGTAGAAERAGGARHSALVGRPARHLGRVSREGAPGLSLHSPGRDPAAHSGCVSGVGGPGAPGCHGPGCTMGSRARFNPVT